MNYQTILALDKLKRALNIDSRIIELVKCNIKIENDENIKNVSNDFLKSGEKYTECLSSPSDKNKFREEMLKRQDKLLSFEAVKQYNEAYQKVSDLYLQMEYILFENIKSYIGCQNCHD